MPHNLKPIEMHQAYRFDCNECGRENFCRSVVADLPPEEMAEAKEALGVEPWEDGQIVWMPETVTCEHCGMRYATHDPRADEGDCEEC